jgi:predicted metallo-beta-lactamase superfamily hydrolase
MRAPEYRVKLGQTARTILYEDSLGTLCFVFDVCPRIKERNKEWTLTLSKAPLVMVSGKPARYERDPNFNQERAESALRRVEEWASSRGYQISVE